MTQKTQKKYSLSPLKKYLKEYPNATNDGLYSLCNAITASQKSSVRKKKQRFVGKKNDTTSNEDKDEITSLTPDTVGKLIKDKLNNKSNIPDTQIRMALDYLIKLKISESGGMEELNMEGFLKHELYER